MIFLDVTCNLKRKKQEYHGSSDSAGLPIEVSHIYEYTLQIVKSDMARSE